MTHKGLPIEEIIFEDEEKSEYELRFVRLHKFSALGDKGEIKEVWVYRHNARWAKPIETAGSWIYSYRSDPTFTPLSALEMLALCGEDETSC